MFPLPASPFPLPPSRNQTRKPSMNPKVTLTITSLLSTVLFASHWADEVSRGMEPGTIAAFGGIVILIVLLSGPLVLGARRSGYTIMLLGGIFGLGVLVLHMTGKGMVGGRIPPNSPGAYFWVWTLIVLGSTSTISGILAARGIWRLRTEARRLTASMNAD